MKLKVDRKCSGRFYLGKWWVHAYSGHKGAEQFALTGRNWRVTVVANDNNKFIE